MDHLSKEKVSMDDMRKAKERKQQKKIENNKKSITLTPMTKEYYNVQRKMQRISNIEDGMVYKCSM
jgi:hypothetical protein